MDKKSKISWYIGYLVVFLIAVFIVGPIVQNKLINPMKPYILVDQDEYIAAQKCQAKAQKACELPPVLPVEMKATSDSTTNTTMFNKVMRLPVDKVPTEYVPYVHYPESWSSFWNPFQPSGIGPPLKTALDIMVPVFGFAVIGYGVWMWRKGRFKNFVNRLKP